MANLNVPMPSFSKASVLRIASSVKRCIEINRVSACTHVCMLLKKKISNSLLYTCIITEVAF